MLNIFIIKIYKKLGVVLEESKSGVVLHVTESFGGGITSAVNTYVDHSNGYQHYLVACVRDSDKTGEEGISRFKDVRFLNRNFSSVFDFISFVKKIDPNIIHVHSSFAGFLIRVLPGVSKKKIVYTPHGYAFLRRDNRLALFLYSWVERVLASRCGAVAGCSKHEALLATSLSPAAKVFELINVATNLQQLEVPCKMHLDNIVTVAMVGRICDQKGYQFFAETSRISKGGIRFKWIGGGGSDRANKLLIDSGVEVTGWISREGVLKHLSSVDIYFHSAAWDGFPISVLEAASLKKPLILRKIGPFESESLYTVASPHTAALEILRFSKGDDEVVERAYRNTTAVSDYHSSENLSASLISAYTYIINKSGN